MPPPAPRACFGRTELIEEIVGLVEKLEPVALIGAGGIGKTSIALTVLHDNRIKQRFGENRRFIRCDQFPATLPHFLSRLSAVTGAGVENPESLAPLLPFLSSKEILIILDNAESILDPQGMNAREIYTSVEELCQLDTICVCITSRISTIPPDCETLEIPTLSMEAAREVFYRIYKNHGRSDSVDDALEQLEFHPLSVTLLATVAQQNKWGFERLVREWEGRRTDTLETEHRTSLAATIELSLASPMFEELGPDARGLLGVVAFYPQGIVENQVDRFFPTISNVASIFDKFCVLSLTYRSNGFITMLAPLRDSLRPKDPKSSPHLCATKEHYFARMTGPGDSEVLVYEGTQWIRSEDINVEHLLDVFTSVDPDSQDIWDTCGVFFVYLTIHKPRQTVLKKKIESLPDEHHSKPECLFRLGVLFGQTGRRTEEITFLGHALKLWGERGDVMQVALVLGTLSAINRQSGHCKEGIHQAREAFGIYEWLGKREECAESLISIARLLQADGQLDAAEEAVLESIKLFPEGDKEMHACDAHHALGGIYFSKGEEEKAIYHFEEALKIATAFGVRRCIFLCWLHMADLFLQVDKLDDAQVCIRQAKPYSLDSPNDQGHAVILQAMIWYGQHRSKDAVSEALHAQQIFEKLGNLEALERCKNLLELIQIDPDMRLPTLAKCLEAIHDAASNLHFIESCTCTCISGELSGIKQPSSVDSRKCSIRGPTKHREVQQFLRLNWFRSRIARYPNNHQVCRSPSGPSLYRAMHMYRW